MSIAHLFNKFAGKEVAVTETQQSINIGGTVHTFNEVSLAPNDPVVKAMQKTAEDNGLHLRLWLPGSMGTCDYRTDRVNAHVDKGPDGKWRVGNRFDLG